MAKKQLLLALLSLVFLAATRSYASNYSQIAFKYQEVDSCQLPAPTNFRVLGSGPTFTNLMWEPSVSGASHTIKVFNQSNPSLPVGTYHNVSGNTFTVTNLAPDSTYEYSIATECQDGSPSGIYAYLKPPHTLILELVLEGRTPVAPNYVEGCDFTNTAFNWTGFKIETTPGYQYSSREFFEYKNNGIHSVKRISPAVLGIVPYYKNLYPHKPSPIWVGNDDDSSFEIWHLTPFKNIYVGDLTAYYDYVSKKYKICITDGTIWNSNYLMVMTTADQVEGFDQPISNRTFGRTNITDSQIIQTNNPVHDFIDVEILNKGDELSSVVQVSNMDGKVLVNQEINNAANISIPVGFLPNGQYILTYKTKNVCKAIILLKI